MIRKHTTFIDKSIETADLGAYMAAQKFAAILANLASKISLRPERSIASVMMELRDDNKLFGTWEAKAFGELAQTFFKAAKLAYRTETVIKIEKPSRNPLVRSIQEIPDEPHVLIGFHFFKKSEKQALAGLSLYFGEHGRQLDGGGFSHQQLD